VAILSSAFLALQRNLGPLLFYLCVGFVVYSARLAIDTFVLGPKVDEASESFTRFYRISSDIVAVAAVAFAQTIAFSRIGRDIDKPMWRVEDDWEALRRFYGLWLLLGLTNVAALQVVNIIAATTGDDSTGFLLGTMWLSGAMLIIPFGSAVMFYGHVKRQEVGEALSTMLRHFPYTFLFAFIGFFFRYMFILIQPDLPLWARPALAIADAYLECFLFACMWLVCIYHRDDFEQPDNQDFDF